MSDQLAQLQQLADSAASLRDVEVASLSGSELEARLYALVSVAPVLAAATAEAVAAFDASMQYEVGGHRTSAGWLRANFAMRSADAKRLVGTGKRLRHMDLTMAALWDGRITLSHADRLARSNKTHLYSAFADAEAYLIEAAVGQEYTDFDKVVSYWDNLADQSAAEKREKRRFEQRYANCYETLDAMTVFSAWLDPVSGAEVRMEFERLCTLEYQKDWDEARTVWPADEAQLHLGRTAQQRGADALLSMARASAAHGVAGKPADHVVTVVMDYESWLAELYALDTDLNAGLDDDQVGERSHRYQDAVNRFGSSRDGICETDTGTIIAPSEALDMALGGWVRRMVIGPKGHMIDYGRKQRLFPKHLGDAIRQTSHGHCEQNGCLQPARQCQIDHQQTWSNGGTTDPQNARVLCGFHNRLRNVNLGGTERNKYRRRRKMPTIWATTTGNKPPEPANR